MDCVSVGLRRVVSVYFARGMVEKKKGRSCPRAQLVKDMPLRRMGESRYCSIFLTSTLDRGYWSGSRPGHLTPREGTLVSIEWDAGCAAESVWTTWRIENLAFPGIEPESSSPSLYRLNPPEARKDRRRKWWKTDVVQRNINMARERDDWNFYLFRIYDLSFG